MAFGMRAGPSTGPRLPGMLFQVFREEVREFAEGDEAYPVIQIHMPGSGDDMQFLRFRREPVRVFAELDGVRLFRPR